MSISHVGTNINGSGATSEVYNVTNLPVNHPGSHVRVYTLRQAVVHCLDDKLDPRELDGDGRAQGDEVLEGAEGNDDNFGFCR